MQLASQLAVELESRYRTRRPAAELSYAPLPEGLTYRATRRYELAFDGERAAADAFVRHLLWDEVAEKLHEDEPDDVSDGVSFYLERAIKPGCLDLEQEAIMAAYAALPRPSGWTLRHIAVSHRFYFYGAAAVNVDAVVRDMVNPVIHRWRIGGRG
jgi:hypothetical protein